MSIERNKTVDVEKHERKKPSVKAVHLESIGDPVSQDEYMEPKEMHSIEDLSLLYDVSVDVVVELGRTRKSLRDIVNLAEGSLIPLDKLAGEPVDVRIDDKVIARGEVVVIDEDFGIRITEIVSKLEDKTLSNTL